MNKKLEKEFDEEFIPTWSRDIRENENIEIPGIVYDILNYNSSIKDFVDKHFIAKEDAHMNVTFNTGYEDHNGEPLYTKQQVEELIGEDDEHQGDCDKQGQYTCECGRTRANLAKQEIRDKLR